VPLSLPATTLRKAGVPGSFEVRGEVMMPLTFCERMNKERKRQRMPQFANARNAAAGTIRVLEPETVARRRLDFYAYSYLSTADTSQSANPKPCERSMSWVLR